MTEPLRIFDLFDPLREKVAYQRDVKREAGREQAAEALEYVLAAMDRIEAGQ